MNAAILSSIIGSFAVVIATVIGVVIRHLLSSQTETSTRLGDLTAVVSGLVVSVEHLQTTVGQLQATVETFQEKVYAEFKAMDDKFTGLLKAQDEKFTGLIGDLRKEVHDGFRQLG